MYNNRTINIFKIFLINEIDSITLKIDEEYNNHKYYYICNFSLEEIIKIHKIFYLYNDSIEELYNYLKKILGNKQLIIKKIINITLLINYILDDKEINIEFVLSKISPNFINNINGPLLIKNNNINIINDIKKNEINLMQKDNNILSLENEIQRSKQLYENRMNQHIYFNSDPTKLTLNCKITENCSTSRWTTNHSFDIFKSILNEYLVAYGNNSKNYSIEFYDITKKN